MLLNRKSLISLTLIGSVLLTGCSQAKSVSNVPNSEKPLVWFNRQPSLSDTDQLDLDAVNFNANTYYVGYDMIQGAKLQGQMIEDYLEENGAALDRNQDGIIGYVLAIGDAGHNISIARTRGVREALKTAVITNEEVDASPYETNLNGDAKNVQDGHVTLDGKDYTVRELASREMVTKNGATWDADAAKSAIKEWSSDFGNDIDLIVSNNDGMGMAMFDTWAHSNGVPVFGYDANGDCVAATMDGFCGSISQHADVQTYLTLRVLRNCLDGVDVNTGIGIEDDAGNILSSDDYFYKEDERAFYALNVAVTADNYQDFLDPRATYAPVSHQLDKAKHPTKKVFLNIYNKEDDFLSQTYQPLLQQYAYLLNLDIVFIGGNGHDESSITSSLNPAEFDAFAINMIKTDNASEYTSILSK